MTVKTCTRCGESKPLDKFYDESRYLCIRCEREAARWRMGRYENKVRNAWRNAKKEAAKYGVEDTLTLDDVAYIFALSGGRDSYTGKFAVNLSLEHIIPFSRGGANALWNIVAVDRSINSSKHDTDPSEWLQMQGRYDVENELTELMAARKGVSVEEMQAELLEYQKEYNDEWYRVHVLKKAVTAG